MALDIKDPITLANMTCKILNKVVSFWNLILSEDLTKDLLDLEQKHLEKEEKAFASQQHNSDFHNESFCLQLCYVIAAFSTLMDNY